MGLLHFPTFTIENLLNVGTFFPVLWILWVGDMEIVCSLAEWRNLMWRPRFTDKPKNPTPEPFQTWCAACASIYIHIIYMSWLSPLHICLVLCRFLFDRHNNVPKFIQHPTTYFKKNTNKKTSCHPRRFSNISGFDSGYEPSKSFRCQHMKELFDPLPRSWI